MTHQQRQPERTSSTPSDSIRAGRRYRTVPAKIDLVAMVRVREHQEIADVVADRLNKVPGVLRTETHIAFRTFSKHDLDAAFSLGAEKAD